jgi:hypothetical protein
VARIELLCDYMNSRMVPICISILQHWEQRRLGWVPGWDCAEILARHPLASGECRLDGRYFIATKVYTESQRLPNMRILVLIRDEDQEC